jgi:hypothetical protein
MRVLLCILIALSGMGCRYILSEPLPDVVKGSASVQQVPDRVLASFVRAQPTGVIDRIETYTFKGKVTSYQFFYRDGTGLHELQLDRDGEIMAQREVFR